MGIQVETVDEENVEDKESVIKDSGEGKGVTVSPSTDSLINSNTNNKSGIIVETVDPDGEEDD